MKKKNFPAVQAISPSKTLQALGIDEGTILRYNSASGMYVASEESEDVGPGDQYHYFSEAVGFSKAIIDTLLQAGGLKEIEQEKEEEKQDEPEIRKASAERNKDDVEVWETAELTMVCGRCGAEELVTQGVGGTTIFMPTNSHSETRLVCKECGNKMTLLYRNGRDLTDKEREVLERKQAEESQLIYDELDKEQALKEKQDEPQKESD